jgi:hypothetical protein
MEPKDREQKRGNRNYEVTPDGRLKVNLSQLMKSDKVREFYRSIESSRGEKAVKKK